MVALGGYGDRYPRQLSGGQQQRVALARAIVFLPDVLLLDEPLGALDKMLREQMQVELRQLQRRLGTTTVFVTHDQEEALTMSDRVAVMRDGRIEQAGPPQEIYERPRNEFVATFLGASNILSGTIRERRGSEHLVEVAGAALRVSAAGRAVGERVTLALRPEKVRLAENGRVTVKLKNVVYRGAQTHLYADLNGIQLAAFVPNAEARPVPLEPGADLGLDWDDRSLVVLE
jgi:ABC-type Fe3+/spermidine/putrescine transport system ATPase subunit